MCADILNIKSQIVELENANIEYLHMDIMDGVFVPNITLSNTICKQIRKITSIPFDYHLMITEPENKVDWFDIKENDMVSAHIEALKDVDLFINKVHNEKAKVGLAISPDTPISKILPYTSKVDFFLVMTVYPGFAGQKLVEKALPKIVDLRKYLDSTKKSHIEIEVDGNVSFENAKKMRNLGANIFVGGSSSVFYKELSIKDATNKLRLSIKEGE